MPLKEIRGSATVFQDNDSMNLNRMGTMLGISGETVGYAAHRAHVRVFRKQGRANMPKERHIRISQFPEVIRELGATRVRNTDYAYHTWARDIDTTQDFKLHPPSGITVIWEYAK